MVEGTRSLFDTNRMIEVAIHITGLQMSEKICRSLWDTRQL
jgi:hypothetical protein